MKLILKRAFFIGMLLGLFCNVLLAREIKGLVLEAGTNEPLPFVNVYIPGTTTGTVTNDKGEFSLVVKEKKAFDLQVSYVGYVSITKRIEMKSADMHFNFKLKPNVQALSEVVVKADFSYDKYMYKKVLKNKKKNNQDRINSLAYTSYYRGLVMMNSNKESKLSKVLEKSEGAILHDRESGKKYVPIFMNEELNNVTQHDGNKENTLIENKTDCVFPQLNNEINALILEKVTVDFNFYDNYISLLDKSFPSPLHNNAFVYYKIYLSDSTEKAGRKMYKFSFYPRNKHAAYFKGYMLVDAETFALAELKAKLPRRANLNFISGFRTQMEYEPDSTGFWFAKNQKVKFRLSLKKSADADSSYLGNVGGRGVLVNMQTNYSAYKHLEIENQSNYIPEIHTDLLSIQKTKALAPMDSIEQMAYKGIQEIKKNRIIKTFDQVGNMFLSGYLNANKLDIGPVFDFYSRNGIEDHRVTLPLRTSEKMFKNFTIGGFLGYGTKNKEFQYGLNAKLRFPSLNNAIWGISYSDDYLAINKDKFLEFVKENPYAKGNGNLVSAFTSSELNYQLVHEKKIQSTFQYQVNNYIGFLIRPYWKKVNATDYARFQKNNQTYSHYKAAGVFMNLRLSFDQHYEEQYFSRIYYGNKKPIFNFSADLGKVSIPGWNGEKIKPYYHLHAAMKNRFNIGMGYLRGLVNVGYIGGDVPYSQYMIPKGTGSLGYGRYNFNLLKPSTVVSDMYANLHLSLNGGGILFNRLPLISHLNFREVVSVKAFYGKLNHSNSMVFDLPSDFSKPDGTPHVEMGVGVSNIFKCLRIEYVQRMNNNEFWKEKSVSHGIRMRFEVTF